MPLTRDFKETVRERGREEPEFRQALLKSAVRCMLNGEVEVGRIILSDYINSGERNDSLMHKLSANGNPSVDNLLGIVAAVAEHEDIELEVHIAPRSNSERQLAA